MGSRAWSNLSPGRAPFFGRKREQDVLLHLLRRGTRLVTITGPSGMGKTRLARQVASAAGPQFCDHGGVWFCSLVACSSSTDVHAVVAQALSIPQQEAPSLSAAIADLGPLLMVLDNLEHVSHETAPLVEEWLDHCPELQIVSTSLVPLGIAGEVRFELGPLEEHDAVDLYLDRARSAWADRSFSTTEQPVIEELVKRLDGLPLAIELAAARVRILPPRQLLTRIAERLELLHSERPGRHSSLLEALSLSWNLLSQEEQRLLAHASVFVGGFTLEAAEEVLAQGDGRASVRGLLSSLRDKALVQLDEGESARFSLYESVHAFAALRLRDLGQQGPAHQAHADFYLRNAELHAERSNGPDAPASVRWLVAERENLVAVHRRSRASDPSAAVRVGLALSGILAQQGPPASELEILDGTVEAAMRLADRSLLAHSLWARSRSHNRQGRPEEARADIDEGLRIARSIGHRIREGYLLAASGAVRAPPGGTDEAIRELELAHRIGVEESDDLLVGLALLVQGSIHESRGDLAACRVSFETSLSILRRIGHLRYQGVAHLNLGVINSHQGRFSAARQAFDEAQRISALLENQAAEAYVFTNLGGVALADGDVDEADRHFMHTLGLEKRVGNRLLRAIAIGGLGLTALARGFAREAEQKLSEAVAILREIGSQRHLATHLPFRAATLALLGRLDEARLDMKEARTTFEALGDARSLRMLEVLEGIIELGEARTLAQSAREAESRALEEKARARFADAIGTQDETVEGFFVARRLLEQTLQHRDTPHRPAARSTRGLVVGPGTAWFELDGKERIDLQRRTAIRLILRGLVEQRLIAPGVGLSQQELAQIGWPGEQIHPDAAATRVWSGIRTLRSLGLTEVLLRHADGYLLGPDVPVSRTSEGSEPGGVAAAETG